MRTSKMIILAVLSLLFLVACNATIAGTAPVCNAALFIDHVIVDVPVELGSTLMPGVEFTKTWRLQNEGTCTWDEGYALVLLEGDSIGAPDEISLGSAVASGESLDISVTMAAPETPGTYSGEWMLRNAEGEFFGVGADNQKPLLAEIVVPELPEGVVYDFNQMVCMAEWHSGLAEFLPCEGDPQDDGDIRIGYVYLAEDAALEHRTANTQPSIVVKPNNQPGGWIAGFFPAAPIQAGDEFVATIGCLDHNPDCSLLFHLDYELPDGRAGSLSSFPEEFNEIASEIRVDLSELAGEQPRLILRVEEAGGRSLQAIGFWLDAQVIR